MANAGGDPSPIPSTAVESPPPPAPTPPPPQPAGSSIFAPCCVGRFALPVPAVRVTSEYDSDGGLFSHKVSCRFFERLAKLKLSFQNDRNGDVSAPRLGLITKNLSVLYDMEDQNAFVKFSADLAPSLTLRAEQDVKSGQAGKENCYCVECSENFLSLSCTYSGDKSVVSSIKLGSIIQFKHHYKEAREGEIGFIATLVDPSYKLEMASAVPSVGLPRATLRFPAGQLTLEERENEMKRILSVSGMVKGQIMNGIYAARLSDDELNLTYAYKDEQMTVIPSVSFRSKEVSCAFKRQFSPSDKLSYLYNFDSNDWSAVYKRIFTKDIKVKAGYDSKVRLGWGSLWVGNEDGRAKAAPMKMKVQLMIQVPQDDIASSALMFRVKKRWDF